MTDRLREITRKETAMEFVKRHDLEWFSFRDGINPKEAAFILIAFSLISLATIGAAAGGWLFVNVIIKRPEYSTAVTLFTGGTLGFLAGMYVFDWLLTASAGSYEAQMKQRPDDSHPGISIARARSSNRRLILSERDKLILQPFARRYPMIRTLGINEWEGDDSPLVFDWISKRDAIKRVQEIVVGLDYGKRDGRGGVKVTPDFDGRIIPDWQNGIFEHETPLPSNGRTTPAQEVGHE